MTDNPDGATPPGGAQGSTPGGLLLGAVAFLGGAAVMTLELAAVRLLAPRFGDSAPVWTNTIGVILVALALGASLGGRLAGGPRPGATLAKVFAGAAVLAALVPWIAQPIGAWLLPPELPLDAAMGALVQGSLAATTLLFAPPVVLLGCVFPLLVTLRTRAGAPVGQAAGMVSTWSTLGSLVGTFATTHLLVPGIGSRATLWLAAGAMLVCAALLGARRSLAPGAAAGLLAALLIAGTPLRPAVSGYAVLAERESRYQYLQVLENTDPASPELGARLLTINEGLDSFHSVRLPDTPFTGGRYYDYHAVAPLLAGDGMPPDSLRVLSLGSAAGTFQRLLEACYPGAIVDAVELDPAVVALGQEFFGLEEGKGRQFAGLDGRVYADHGEGPYEVVLVDAYESQVYVPAHLASIEFMSSVRDRLLRDAGVLALNVGGHGPGDPVAAHIAATVAAAFGRAWIWRVPSSRNLLVMARKGVDLDPGALGRVSGLDQPSLMAAVEAMADPELWVEVAAPGEGGDVSVLRDDRPVLDALLEEEWGEGSTAPMVELTAIDGSADPEVAAAAAQQAISRGHHLEALEQVKGATRATPMLRTLAGNARWMGTEFDGARAEFEAALQLQPDSALEVYLRNQLQDLAGMLETREQARTVGGRNSWVALVSLALLLGAWLLINARLGR